MLIFFTQQKKWQQGQILRVEASTETPTLRMEEEEKEGKRRVIEGAEDGLATISSNLVLMCGQFLWRTFGHLF